jgi:hypothetical protein
MWRMCNRYNLFAKGSFASSHYINWTYNWRMCNRYNLFAKGSFASSRYTDWTYNWRMRNRYNLSAKGVLRHLFIGIGLPCGA